MNIAVRYCSKTKFGNTRRIAEAIAEGAGVKAVSIADELKLAERADVGSGRCQLLYSLRP